jgi:hypothetical protein
LQGLQIFIFHPILIHVFGMNNMKVQILEFGIAFCWLLLVEFITERAFAGSFWLSLSQKELLLAPFA